MLAAISKSIPMGSKIDNVDAVKKRDNTATGGECDDGKGPYPKRWAGTVVENLGRWQLKGKDMSSGVWGVMIESKDLRDTVYANVNEDRKPGDKVQFVLLPGKHPAPTCLEFKEIPEGRYAQDPIFKKARKPNVGQLEFSKNPSWRRGMFGDDTDDEHGSGQKATSSALATK